MSYLPSPHKPLVVVKSAATQYVVAGKPLDWIGKAITDRLEKFAFVKERRVGKRRVRMSEVQECRKNRSVYGSWIFRAYGKEELSVHIISCVESHVIIPR